MPTLLPWTSVAIGDLDVFAPALPSLVVYTWYVDGEPESTVTTRPRVERTCRAHDRPSTAGPYRIGVAAAPRTWQADGPEWP